VSIKSLFFNNWLFSFLSVYYIYSVRKKKLPYQGYFFIPKLEIMVSKLGMKKCPLVVQFFFWNREQKFLIAFLLSAKERYYL